MPADPQCCASSKRTAVCTAAFFLLAALLFLAPSCAPKSQPPNFGLLALLFGQGGSGPSAVSLEVGSPADVDRNGSVDGIVLDASGDGVADGLDTDGDGSPDLLLVDTNSDSVPDAIDANGDGSPDYYLSPGGVTTGPDGTGSKVVILPGGYDTNGDGTVDNPILGAIAADVTPPASVLSIPAGTYASARSVRITCSDAVGPAAIVYTTDGSTPTFAPLHGTAGLPPTVGLTIGNGGSGSYTLQYRCRDLAGNVEATKSAVFVIDSTIPDVQYSSLSAAYISNSAGAIGNAAFNWTSSRSGTFSIRRGATSCGDGTIIQSGAVAAAASNVGPTLNASAFAAGATTVFICVVDGANGQTGFTSFTITRDDTAPSVTANPGGGSYGTATSVALSCSDTGGSGCDKIAYVTGASTPAITGTTGAITTGTLYTTGISMPDGSTTSLHYVARDNAGNVSSPVTQSYTVDTAVATVTINSVTPGAVIPASVNPEIVWQSNRSGTYSIRLDAADCASGTLATGTNVNGSVTGNTPVTSTITSLGSGAHTVRICVQNLVGNVGSTSTGITRDATAPTVTSTVPTNGASGVDVDATLSVTFSEAMSAGSVTMQSASGACSGTLQVSANNFTSCLGGTVNASSNPTFNLSPTSALASGTTYKIRVTTGATDPAGNALSSSYTQATGFMTALPPVVCGNGVPTGAETCDDGNLANGDGCSNTCQMETGFMCTGSPSVCTTICGDGVVAGTEACDDGNLAGGDGCSNTCQVAAGYTCVGSPSVCSIIPAPADVELVGSRDHLSCWWSNVASATGFKCYYSTTNTVTKSSSVACTGMAGARSCTIPGAVSGSTYYIRVTSIGSGGGEGPLSSIASGARLATTANETGDANEITYCALEASSPTVTSGVLTPALYAQVYHMGYTEAAGANGAVLAQVGYGPPYSNPTAMAGWTFVSATWNSQVGNNDRYTGAFVAPAAGVYRWAFRFSVNGGALWTYCDLDGAGSNAGLLFEPDVMPTLTAMP